MYIELAWKIQKDTDMAVERYEETRTNQRLLIGIAGVPGSGMYFHNLPELRIPKCIEFYHSYTCLQ
jgi:hypothetical protein